MLRQRDNVQYIKMKNKPQLTTTESHNTWESEVKLRASAATRDSSRVLARSLVKKNVCPKVNLGVLFAETFISEAADLAAESSLPLWLHEAIKKLAKWDFMKGTRSKVASLEDQKERKKLKNVF